MTSVAADVSSSVTLDGNERMQDLRLDGRKQKQKKLLGDRGEESSEGVSAETCSAVKMEISSGAFCFGSISNLAEKI
ncbi:hypothetical protein CDAR_608121 [Caerostris darwini]|uniref:Uncharacterized protein n=1 Tax=Caerostris darwini TaxID=1538125 RepID=A0AAV4Q2T4_9ARAC|nr:hypothetical protein CDAR_608121 [Caerostris darwini]